MENFFSADEQRSLADCALLAGHPDGTVPISPTGFLASSAERISRGHGDHGGLMVTVGEGGKGSNPTPASHRGEARGDKLAPSARAGLSGDDDSRCRANPEPESSPDPSPASSSSYFYTPSYADDAEGHGRELKLHMCTLGRHWDLRRGEYAATRTDHDGRPVRPLPPEFKAATERALRAARQMISADQDGSAGTTDGAADRAAWACADPDIGIVNMYDRAGRLGLHQDSDESEASILAGKPVVSFSFGDTAIFEFVEAATLQAYIEARCTEAGPSAATEAGTGVGAAASRVGDGALSRGALRLSASEIDSLPRRAVKLGSGDVLIFGGPSRLIYHGVSKILPHSCKVRPWNTMGIKRGRLNVTLREY